MLIETHNHDDGPGADGDTIAPVPSPWAAPLPRLSNARVMAVAWCLAVAMLATRRPDQILFPQFYADDSVFFADSVRLGWLAVFRAHGGYVHVVPRLIACLLQSVVSWEWTPLAYSLAATAITAWVAVRLVSARLPGVAAITCALGLVAVPHSGEVFLNLCSLHFILALLLVVNLLEPPPVRRREAFRRAVEMGLAALSGPEVFVLLPAALLRGWQWRKQPRALPTLSGLLVGATIQLTAMISNPRTMKTDGGTLLTQPVQVLPRYMEVLFAHWRGVGYTPVAGWVATTIVFVVLAILFIERPNPFRLQAAFLLAGAALFLAAGRVSAPGWGNPLGMGARYVYLPFVLGFSALGWLWTGTTRGHTRALAGLLLATILTSAATDWVCVIPRNYHWREQVEEVRQGRRTHFIVPPGWEFEVPRRSQR